MNNTIRRYVAVVLKERGKPYLATVPDLGACFATGETIEAAKASLPDALALHIEGMIADRRKLPSPHTRIEVLASIGKGIAADYVIEIEPPIGRPLSKPIMKSGSDIL